MIFLLYSYFNQLYRVSGHWIPPCLGMIRWIFQPLHPTHENALPRAPNYYFMLHLHHSVQLRRLRKVSLISSLLPPSFDIFQGDPPQFLSVSLQTYWRVCTVKPLVIMLFSHKHELVEWLVQLSHFLSLHTLMHKMVTSFHNCFHPHNDIKPKQGLPLPCCTMK
jgi:hypothetical protein